MEETESFWPHYLDTFIIGEDSDESILQNEISREAMKVHL